jgi:hypothetical protein
MSNAPNICVIDYFSAWLIREEEVTLLKEAISKLTNTVFVLFSDKEEVNPENTKYLIDLASKLGIKHSFQEGYYDYHRYINTVDPQKPYWITFDELDPLDPIAYMEKTFFSPHQSFSFDKELFYEQNYADSCSLAFYSTRSNVKYIDTKSLTGTMFANSLIELS